MSSPSDNAPVELTTAEDLQQRSIIDRSTKAPVLFFLTSGTLWLVLSSLMGFLASIKLVVPHFLDAGCLWWLNWGRLQPAFINALIYGWGVQAALGVGIWIMARLCRAPLRNPVTLLVAGHLWNFGVVIGVVNIFAGNQAPGELLEFGRSAWLLLLTAFVIIAIWIVLMYLTRPEGTNYISQQYIIGALFWFAWLYTTGNLFSRSGSGLHAAVSASWYANGLLFLFLVPVAVAAAYYLIPKIVGKPIHSYSLAQAGFWALAIVGGWAGVQRLTGAPLPQWMPSLSAAAQVFLLIPVACVAVNHFYTVQGSHGLVQVSPTLRFTFFGAVFYVASHLVAALVACFPGMLQFTLAQDGVRMMVVYSYFTMAMFGAISFIVPRLTGCEWLSPKMIRFHFWWSAYGSIAMALLLVIGGVAQGQSIGSWDKSFIGAVENSRGYLIGQIVAWFFIALSNLMFFLHISLMVLRLGRRSERATLLPAAHSHDDYDHAEVVITTEGAEA